MLPTNSQLAEKCILPAGERVFSPLRVKELTCIVDDINVVHDHLSSLEKEAQQKGYQRGLAEASKACFETIKKCQAAETRMLDIVITAIEKITGDIQAQQLTPTLVLNTLRELSEPLNRVAVYVHPSLVSNVLESIQKVSSMLTIKAKIEVKTDPDMSLTDCRLETEWGFIEAGLHTQLRAIKKALLSP